MDLCKCLEWGFNGPLLEQTLTVGGLEAVAGIVEVFRKEFQGSSEPTHNVGGLYAFCNDRLRNGDFVTNYVLY